MSITIRKNAVPVSCDVMNCPYGVLKPDDATKSIVIKCDFCKDQGGEPSCVKACPKEAIWVEEVQA